tara:strand:- start:1304 stop:1753 length:450 start_codon:yes stop_codon:yes gene_type:complete
MNDYDEYKIEIECLNENDLIQELPSYSINNTQTFIRKLKRELDQQKTINNILKSDEDEIVKHKEYIKQFSKNFSPKIKIQLQEIKNISNSLQDLVSENNELKKSRNELADIYSNKEYTELAKSLTELREEKKILIDFLKNMNITTPQLD